VRILVLNQYFHPDRSATAQLLTELCEDLSRRHELHVISGRPSYNVLPADAAEPAVAPDSVRVSQTWSTSFDRAWMPGRLTNYATYLSTSLFAAIASQRPDVVLAWTDPPLIGMVAALAARSRRVPFVLGTQDIFPDVAIELGRLRSRAAIAVLRRASNFQLRSAARVVSLGRDMNRRLIDLGVPESRIRTVSNWSDGRVVRPREPSSSLRSAWQIDDHFVVMHSGNVGLTQGLETLLDAAEILREHREIAILIVGDGAAKGHLERESAQRGLTNVRFLDFQPKASLSESLGAADAHLVALKRGLEGFIVPSKLYGIMAAGRPVIAATAERSEAALVVAEHDCGIRVEPDDPAALADAILRMRKADREAMGRRARHAFERLYDRPLATSAYEDVLVEAVQESRAG
jgi:colanic acid biosynthesis glycosyl transferase WcaI